MRKLKQALALFLTMAMLLTAVPVSALAAEAVTEDPASAETMTEPETPVEEPEEPAEEPQAPVEEPETPGEEPEAPAEEPETPEEEPEVPGEEPEAPGEEPETPAQEPEVPADEPETPAAEEPQEPATEAEESETVTDGEEQEYVSFFRVENSNYDGYHSAPITMSDMAGQDFVVDSNCYDSATAAGNAIREYLESRTTAFRITYTDTYAPSSSRIDQIIQEYAMAHTGNPTEGDYLMFQWDQYSGGWYQPTYSNGTYTVTVELYFSYYTTASQERAVDTAVYNLRKSLGLSSKNDYEAVNAIYNWICSHVKYDYAHVNMGKGYPHQFTAYGAIMDRTCVCQGYAVLFYRMALEEGIDARVISGDGGGPHAWNIVELNNKYYNLDSTWDAGYAESNWNWFLRCPNNFTGHYRDSVYNTSSFHSKYPMDNVDYVKRINLRTPVLASVYNQTNGVKLTWNAVTNATSYDVYRKTNGGSWGWVNNVKGTSYINAGVTSGNTYTYTVRAKTSSIQSGFDSAGLTIRYLATPTVKAANVGSGIQVAWNAVKGASQYQVWRKTSPSGAWSKMGSPTSATSYTDRSVSMGSTYYYTVRAIYGSTQSSYYNSGYAVTAMATPTLKSVQNINGGVQVTWGAVSGASTYQLWRKTSGSSWIKIGSPVSGTTATDKTAKSGTAYYYTVRAISSHGQSDYNRYGIGILYLSAPTVTRIANSHAGINLFWKTTPGANGYNIYRRQGTGSYTRVGVVKGSSSNSFVDTSVQSKGGATYTYRVIAYRGSYASIYRVSPSIVRMDTPGIRSLTQTSSGVNVVWNPIAGCSGYNIYRLDSKNTITKVGYVTGSNSSSFLDKSAKGKKGTYTYRVEAYRGSSKSAYTSKAITLR